MSNLYISKEVSKILKKEINSIVMRGEGIMFYIKKENIVKVLKFLSKTTNIQAQQLLDITAVDYPEKRARFEVKYILLSLLYNQRYQINMRVKDTVASTEEVYLSSGWLEREVWDMFGIYFTGHKDLRRILTDYGFSGYPLRKDFPLSGYVEVRYDDEEKNVVLEPVQLAQEFRTFQFLSPWEK